MSEINEKIDSIISRLDSIEYQLNAIASSVVQGDFKTPQALPPIQDAPAPIEWKLGKKTIVIAQKILGLKPNLTREAVETLIEEERAKAAGLLTEEAAAYLVATNLGIRREKQSRAFPVFETGKYVQEITGELIEDPIVKDVEKRDGSTTQVGNVRLTDGSETIRIAMWGGLADALNTYQKGESVTITGLSVKGPYDGVTQLSSTRNTELSSKK